MSPTEEQGAVISVKEIYNQMQEMNKSLQRIESRLAVFEAKMESLKTVDERSILAKDLAENAINQSNEAIRLAEKLDSHITWIWRTIIIGAGSALFSFFFLK
ncbi:hypothetical protein [Thermoflavimicrobium dichotomicum]|uniref:Haemolysin XhlA n=1 Tax=Thermoflavimicrobium dichotomicum TaxID=46223 RepID=A0A1I3UIS6_9BACL|nr:hypothetical protein [Thermoflavimicrobium dichotomicum]SFJ83394.1 hypothetical protein SAMN05421852_12551 [Thermoflavimicrobium dichotomicum]